MTERRPIGLPLSLVIWVPAFAGMSVWYCAASLYS